MVLGLGQIGSVAGSTTAIAETFSEEARSRGDAASWAIMTNGHAPFQPILAFISGSTLICCASRSQTCVDTQVALTIQGQSSPA